MQKSRSERQRNVSREHRDKLLFDKLSLLLTTISGNGTKDLKGIRDSSMRSLYASFACSFVAREGGAISNE